MIFKELDFALSPRFGPVLIVKAMPGGTYMVVWWGFYNEDPKATGRATYHHELVTESGLAPMTVPEDLQLLRGILLQGAKAWSQAPQEAASTLKELPR